MSQHRKNRVMITGCSGFIGPHLVNECLSRGWEVVGVDIVEYSEIGSSQKDFSFRQHDVRKLSVVDLDGIDFVFHLAFVTNIPNSIKNPLETTFDNIGMSMYLMDLCAQAKVKKFLFASTASLYGGNPTPWKEEMPSDPIEPYSWQKLSIEYACKVWSRRYGLPTTSFRFFQVFGEGQRQDTALAAFLKSKKENKPITLTETTAQSTFRTGQRDFIYVKDLAEACVLAAISEKTGKGEVINIGSGEVITMEQVANAIGAEIVFIPKRGYEVERHQADIFKAKDLLGWCPKIGVLDWIKTQTEGGSQCS